MIYVMFSNDEIVLEQYVPVSRLQSCWGGLNFDDKAVLTYTRNQCFEKKNRYFSNENFIFFFTAQKSLLKFLRAIKLCSQKDRRSPAIKRIN